MLLKGKLLNVLCVRRKSKTQRIKFILYM